MSLQVKESISRLEKQTNKQNKWRESEAETLGVVKLTI